jgi:hypothetical protein
LLVGPSEAGVFKWAVSAKAIYFVLALGSRFADLPFAVVVVMESNKGTMVILWDTIFLEPSVSEIVFVKIRKIRVGAKDLVNIFFSGDSYELPEARITFANDRSGMIVLIAKITGKAELLIAVETAIREKEPAVSLEWMDRWWGGRRIQVTPGPLNLFADFGSWEGWIGITLLILNLLKH